MSDEPVLPHRLTLLGESMRPIWLKLVKQINMPIRQTVVLPKIASSQLALESMQWPSF